MNHGLSVGQKEQARRSIAPRFWARVDRTGGQEACWPWLGARTPDGYGRILVAGERLYAHRLALELALHRLLTEEEQALHDPRTCNNPPCCNPGHLRPGTVKENAQDRLISGTQSHVRLLGEKAGAAKLCDTAVLEIITGYHAATAWGAKGRFFDAMAAKHGVSRRAIEYVAHHGTWTHVTGVRS